MMAKSPSFEDLEDRLRVEFVDDVRDRLQKLYKTLEQSRGNKLPDREAVAVILTEGQNLRGCGTAFGFPAVSLVALKMLEYYTGLAQLTERQKEDAIVFLDRMAELVDRSDQPQLAETNAMVRRLPVRYEFDVADVEVRDIEVLLVTPSKVMARKVTTELAACGFRSVTLQDPIEAIGLAVRMAPDMVMASMVMDGLSGLDLIRALRAMSVTQKIPLALLTSMDASNAALKDIPAGVAVIRTGSKFSDDFATVVTKFNLG